MVVYSGKTKQTPTSAEGELLEMSRAQCAFRGRALAAVREDRGWGLQSAWTISVIRRRIPRARVSRVGMTSRSNIDATVERACEGKQIARGRRRLKGWRCRYTCVLCECQVTHLSGGRRKTIQNWGGPNDVAVITPRSALERNVCRVSAKPAEGLGS